MSAINSVASENMAQPPSEALLVTPQQLAAWLQVSKRSLWRLKSAGQLPAPIRLRKAVRWRVSDIEAWLAAGCPARRI